MSIGGNLRQLRKLRGMTQEQAAARLGVTRQALSSYESGRTRPDIDTLLRLSEIYGTDLDGVLYGSDGAWKAQRSFRRAAAVLAVLLLALTLLSAGVLWSENWFFPVNTDQFDSVMWEKRMRLTDVRDMAEGALLAAAQIGSIVLVWMDQQKNRGIKWRYKVAYGAAVSAGMLLLALPFGLTDAVFSLTNYWIAPIFAAGYL